MPFCSTEHILSAKGESKIAELTGDASGQEVDEEKVQEQIDNYGSIMESAIRRQYPDQPFGQEQRHLRSLNVQGAYLLLERESDRGWTEDHIKQYQMLEKELDKIADGLRKLDSPSSAEVKKKTDGFFSSNKRLFNRNCLAPEL